MKKTAILLIAFLIVSVGFLSGCQEQKTIEKLVTAPLNTFALTLDDLPEKYIKLSDEFNYSEEAFKGLYPIDFYAEGYYYEEHDINSTFPSIFLHIYRFDSSSDANIVIQNLSEQMVNSLDTLNRTTPQNIEQIGDESIYELFKGSESTNYSYTNVTQSFIYFRIGNVVIGLFLQGIMEWEIDYVGLTINYAEIIESRMYTSLE